MNIQQPKAIINLNMLAESPFMVINVTTDPKLALPKI